MGSVADGTATGDGVGGLDIGAMLGDHPKVIEELFPVTLEDSRTGRQHWHEPAAVAEAVAEELFKR